jgi:diguanylate cyclase (GGDEF)-like protein
MTAQPLRVLMIENSADDAESLLQQLRRGGYDPVPQRVQTAEGMLAALAEKKWDLITSEYSLPQFSAPAALKLLRDSGLDLPFLVVSGVTGEDLAVSLMKDGAHDCIMKYNLKRLIPAVERELREAEMRRSHRKAEEMIQRMAYYDLLTDLPNRNMVHDRLLSLIRAGGVEGKPVGLLLMDLDRFKEINDTLGHHRGDILLEQVGLRLKSVLFEPDIVARLGGDEFAILLPRLAAVADIHRVAEKIKNALESPFFIEGLPIVVEASIGIALYPEHGDNPDILMQRADVAMYAAKETGGYVIYDAKHDQHSPRRLALMGELRRAIDQDQLFLHFQPKIELKNDRVFGVEALARWQHPEYGFIPPDQFISAAERTGLMKPLTHWIFEAAHRQYRAWMASEQPLSMAVNLSARNLHDPGLMDRLAGILAPYDGSGEHLEIEITESAIMADPGRALETIMRLRDMGIRFAIDDFGTGYSSLGYLKRLPVQTIKIDKSFVLNMAKDSSDASIVRSTIDLGHNLGLQVVAEGVENRETYDRLKELGCDAAQGYFMCKPLAADDLSRWLEESPFGFTNESHPEGVRQLMPIAGKKQR